MTSTEKGGTDHATFTTKKLLFFHECTTIRHIIHDARRAFLPLYSLFVTVPELYMDTTHHFLLNTCQDHLPRLEKPTPIV